MIEEMLSVWRAYIRRETKSMYALLDSISNDMDTGVHNALKIIENS